MSIGYLKLELLDHGLAAEAQQQIIGCQGGHLIAGGVGGTSNVGEDHCEKQNNACSGYRLNSNSHLLVLLKGYFTDLH